MCIGIVYAGIVISFKLALSVDYKICAKLSNSLVAIPNLSSLLGLKLNVRGLIDTEVIAFT